MKLKKNNCFILLFIVIFIFLLFFIVFKNDDENVIFEEENYSRIYFYDLGSSNIEIIMKDEFVILVNSGLEKDRDCLLDYLDKLGIKEIDYLLLTNRDNKYIENASFLVENFKVDYLYLNDYDYSSDKMKELLDTLNGAYTETIILTINENIKIDGLNINVYPYLENDFKMEDKTLLINIEEGDNSIYLTNDISSKRLDFRNCDLVVSENKDIFNIESKYYIYDGKESKNKSNVLRRDLIIYMNEKELIFDE